jgi:hypothetical protein
VLCLFTYSVIRYMCCVCLRIVLADTCVVIFALFVFALCLVCPILPVTLDCPFFIAPSVFSDVNIVRVCCACLFGHDPKCDVVRC